MKIGRLVMVFAFLSIVLWVDLTLAAADSLIQSVKIEHPEQALDLALRVTGFAPRMKRVPPASTASSFVDAFHVEDDNTPFLSDSVNGKELWRVRLDSVDIRPAQTIEEGYDLWERKSFEIEIDKASGRVIRISTTSKENRVAPEPGATSATAELTVGREKYWGFLDSIPDVSLLEALNRAVGCMPLGATEIVAQCVLYSEGNEPPRPAWIITSRGIPQIQFGAFDKQTPDDSLDRARCVVDATNGVWLRMTNIPRPE